MVKTIENDNEFQEALTQAGDKLVVVDFFATWCGPCVKIAPFFGGLQNKYPNAVFIKVDVDKNPNIASNHGVSAMPTFIFFSNGKKIDSFSGGDPNKLTVYINKHYKEDIETLNAPSGMVFLNNYINKTESECLNESKSHPWQNVLNNSDSCLQSDCDEQLIIRLGFTAPLKLHSLLIQPTSSIDACPKTLKFYTNLQSEDFDSLERMKPIQEVVLNEKDVSEGKLVDFLYVKFQNVSSLTIFIFDNIGEVDVTSFKYFALYGLPCNATNMSDFKRVAGKAGEAH